METGNALPQCPSDSGRLLPPAQPPEFSDEIGSAFAVPWLKLLKLSQFSRIIIKKGLMYMNIFDAFLVLLNFLELIVLPFWDAGNAPELSTNHIRLIKLTRVARTLRVVKTLSMLRQLRHLVATCIASIGALFWSLILLLFLKLIFALMISQTLQIFIQNSDENYEARLLMNTWYGTFSRSMYTFFEITYSGGWPLLVRPVLESVSAWYAIPFLIYVTLVVFATLRIVTALFLKETLSTAANDAEMVIEDSRRFALQYQKKLEDWVEEVTWFKVVDDVGGVWHGMLHMCTGRIDESGNILTYTPEV